MSTAKIEVVFTHVGEHLTVDLGQPSPGVSAQGSAPNGHGSATNAHGASSSSSAPASPSAA